MEPQKPAKGISLMHSWADSATYHVECSCTDPDHAHIVDISLDEDCGVVVEIWAIAETPVWKKSRWKIIWELLTKGTAKYNVALYLDQQQAINYAAVINSAVEELQQRDNNNGRKRTMAQD
jgi:hypothetical protein